MMQRKWAFTALMATMSSLCLAAMVSAETYELSKNDVTDPRRLQARRYRCSALS